MAQLDFLQRAYCRVCKVVGSEGTALWEYSGEKVSVFSAAKNAWEESSWDGFDPSQAYQLEINEFLRAVRESGRPDPDGWEGLRTLELVEAAARSTETGCKVEL